MLTRIAEARHASQGVVPRAKKVAPNFVDQAAFAISNVVLAASFVRFGSSSDLAEFALFYTAWAWFLVVFRTVIGERLLVRLGEVGVESSGEERALVSTAIGAVMLVGSAVAVVGLAISFATGLGPTLGLVFFGTLPALLLQDLFRYWQIGAGKASRAMGADLSWLALQLGFVALIETGVVEATGALVWASWALTGAASLALFPIWSVGLWTDAAKAGMTLRWFADEGRRSRDMLIEAVFGRGALLVGQLLVGVVVSPALLIPIRLARSVMGPLQSLSAVATTASLPGMARLAATDEGSVIKRGSLVGAGVGLVGLAYGAVVSVALGVIDLGEFSSNDSRIAILCLGGLALLQGGSLAGRLVLKALSQSARLAMIRITTGPLAILCTVLFAYLFGWPGLILASAVVAAATVMLMARTLRWSPA